MIASALALGASVSLVSRISPGLNLFITRGGEGREDKNKDRKATRSEGEAWWRVRVARSCAITHVFTHLVWSFLMNPIVASEIVRQIGAGSCSDPKPTHP